MPNKYGVYGCDIEENEVVVLEMGTVIYYIPITAIKNKIANLKTIDKLPIKAYNINKKDYLEVL